MPGKWVQPCSSLDHFRIVQCFLPDKKPIEDFCQLLATLHGAFIGRQGEQREIVPVFVVGEIKHTRKACSGVNRLTLPARSHAFVPASVSLLVVEEPANPFCDTVTAVVTCGEQPENGPCCLRGRADTHSARGWIVVASAAFTPTAIGVLHGADPFCRLLNLRLMVPDANRFKAAQNQECAVQIVDTPAPKPASVRLLLAVNKFDGLLDALVLTRISVGGEHFQNAAGNVYRWRIEHRVMVGKGHILEDHLRIVFVEAGPAAVTALHGEDPVNGPFADIVLITLAWIVYLIQRKKDLGGIINVRVKLVVE